MGNPQKKSHEMVTEHHDSATSPMHASVHSDDEVQDGNCNIPDGQGPITREDTASYIHDMARELKTLAETANFSFLAYLLELVIEESAAQRR